ncbi:PREDICTED: UDP-glycosyltransferase 89C1-like [Tarenaya hassleriana]|uniref:UDP-glycosyltransferase 89C1-like n=1 Tax=Tarenaya hassleriana TaxID=28532 RepID=UPI00053C91CC|nr:PREDICTED: UDP-glycosyltransferase 89C1-like [Tarenaya hassleriana]
MAKNKKTHIMVIPFPQSGHMLPTVDLVHHLLRRHAAVTVVLTPNNLHYLDPLLRIHSPENLRPLSFPFPSHPSIPSGVENMSQLPTHAIGDMIQAFSLLRHPLSSWLESSPDPPAAILSDMFSVPWTNKLAEEFEIKSIAFLPTTAHTLSVIWGQDDRGFFEELMQSTSTSWGLILNTFKELEEKYVEDLKKNFMGHHRVWPVGPILPPAAGSDEDRGGKSSVPVGELTAWLDAFPENSVVYVAFGSQVSMGKAQGEAIAAALEKSGVRFIWAVKKSGGDDTAEIVPRGFEERTAERGRVIRGWAPQKVILEHRAVGSYLTHLGWGSVLEGLIGGTVLLAWPMHADNHFNTKLLADELGAAVKVCDGMDSVPDSDELARVLADSVRVDLPERGKAVELRGMGLAAIDEGGSSYKALDDMVREVGTSAV